MEDLTPYQKASKVWGLYYKSNPNIIVKEATKYSIIHVNGIIKELESISIIQDIDLSDDIKYWQEVLTELNKM